MNKFLVVLTTTVFTILLAFSTSAQAGKRNGNKAVTRAPIGEVHPRIPPNFKTGIFSLKSTEERVAAYKQCMFPEEGRLERALTLNLAVKDSEELFSDPRQLAYEVCLADAMGLARYEDQAGIEAGKASGALVELSRDGLTFPDELPHERRFVTPWAKTYFESLVADMQKYFGIEYTPLRFGSLVRSFVDQRRQRNSPADCKTKICSSHTTGSAGDVSISVWWLGKKKTDWLRARLLADRKRGIIVVIEEKGPPHFHVLVLPPQFVPPLKE